MTGAGVRVVDLTREEVEAGLAEGSIVLVDVREAHEFAAGRVPGSLSLPLSTFAPSRLPLAPGRRVVLTCAAGVRSIHALAAAQGAGLDVTEHYAGGFRDWVLSGGPVER